MLCMEKENLSMMISLKRRFDLNILKLIDNFEKRRNLLIFGDLRKNYSNRS